MSDFKTIATLATYRPRFDKIVWQTVESLLPQCDEVHININPPYTIAEKAAFVARRDKLNSLTGKENKGRVILNFLQVDIGDLGKFYPLMVYYVHPSSIILTCDDDLIYPSDYAATILPRIYDRFAVLSFGGKRLYKKLPYDNWPNCIIDSTSIWIGSSHEKQVHIPMSGVSAFERWVLRPKLEIDVRYRNNADLQLALWARQDKAEVICTHFARGWFDYDRYNQYMANQDTIWSEMNDSAKIQSKTAQLATEVMQYL